MGMAEWKAGDWAMVRLVFVSETAVDVKRTDGHTDFVHKSALHPLPAAKTAQEQAVIDAAVEFVQGPEGSKSLPYWENLSMAVLALLASHAPPDPVAALDTAAQEWAETRGTPHEAVPRGKYDAALARVRKAMEGAR